MAKRMMKNGKQIRANSTVVCPPARPFLVHGRSEFRHFPAPKGLAVTAFEFWI
jgi:hypothetical protein